MNNQCRAFTSLCNGADLRPMRVGFTQTVIVFCEGCRNSTLALSAHLIERRSADRSQLPVESPSVNPPLRVRDSQPGAGASAVPGAR